MKKRSILHKVVPYLLIAPFTVLLLLIFTGFAYTFVQSLGYLPEINETNLTFDYFAQVLTADRVFSETVRSVGVSLFAAILSAVLGVLTAWCIVAAYDSRGIFFHIAKIPLLMPWVVLCLCATTLLSSTGFISRVLTALGWAGAEEFMAGVLFQPNSIGTIIVFVFTVSSLFMYMIIDVMSRTNGSIGEAALNLGASRWSSFKDVVLPNCMPAIRNTFIFMFVYIFGNYEAPRLVGSSVETLLPVQAYMEYSNLHLIPHRPQAMVLNLLMLLIALVVVALVHAWDVHDRKKRGVK